MSGHGRGIHFWKGSIEMSAWFGIMNPYGRKGVDAKTKNERVKFLSLVLASVFRLPRMGMLRHVLQLPGQG